MAKKQQHILIIEDDITFSLILSKYLDKHDYASTAVGGIQDALKLLRLTPSKFDAILLDYHLLDGTAMDVLDFLKVHQLPNPVIIMTSILDIKIAVQAIKKGAKDYITKPINQEELLMQLQEVLKNATSAPQQTKRQQAETNTKDHFVIGHSVMAQQLHKHIELVANTDMAVLIVGESGTGKEHVAKKLHQNSSRKEGPFIAIDCGALSNELAASELFGHTKGAFTGATQDKIGQLEAADGGTIFLDEIANLSYENQVKLLRVLQEKELMPVGATATKKIDVRIITASNEDFNQAISKGLFREDLYHRLNEFKLKIPSLSERIEDLPEFISFFIEKSNELLGKNVQQVSEAVLQIFEKYHWPGNIRELQNVIKRAVLLSVDDIITPKELPEEMALHLVVQPKASGQIHSVEDIKQLNEQQEKELIIKTLMQVQFNKSKAARILKINRTTLYNKLNKYGIIDT